MEIEPWHHVEQLLDQLYHAVFQLEHVLGGPDENMFTRDLHLAVDHAALGVARRDVRLVAKGTRRAYKTLQGLAREAKREGIKDPPLWVAIRGVGRRIGPVMVWCMSQKVT